MSVGGDIVNLNVGGKRFTTSRPTLTWIPDTFFTSLLSGRIQSQMDDTQAIFIDRDPDLFAVILNYLRTRQVNLGGVSVGALRLEAEFYGLTPLVCQLWLCEDLGKATCGGVLFHGYLQPPVRLGSGQVDASLSSLEAQLYRAAVQNAYSARAHSGLLPPGGGAAHLAAAALHLRHDAGGRSVNLLRGHHNWLAVAYPNSVACFRLKDSRGWQLVWQSELLEEAVGAVALHARPPGQGEMARGKLVAAASSAKVRLWLVAIDGTTNRSIGEFSLSAPVDALCFAGAHLVALSHKGNIGVWHAVSKTWQSQDVHPISSYEVAGTTLVLGHKSGSISYIDMQKFPLRMKDNDLLVTELFKDPDSSAITALSLYRPPKTTSVTHNWFEVAYGTASGCVRVMVQHPETVGQGPHLFQTFSVHRSKVVSVRLAEKILVSVCAEYNHVRTWSITRFRGMISTQPLPTPLASFKVVSLDSSEPRPLHRHGTHIGPYGESDEPQVFVQRVVPDSSQLLVRHFDTGARVCEIDSVDDSPVTAFCVHECEGSNRSGSWPRRYIFTGHANGAIQMWDLTTALNLPDPAATHASNKGLEGGPSSHELVSLLSSCELSAASRGMSPAVSPAASLSAILSASSSSLNRYLRTQASVRGTPPVSDLAARDPASPRPSSSSQPSQ